MKNKIKVKDIIGFIIGLIFVVLSTTDYLLNYIIPNSYIRYLILLIMIIYLLIKSLNVKQTDGKILLLLLLMVATFLYKNSLGLFGRLIYISVFSTCFVAQNNINYVQKYLNIANYILFFYGICTIVFFFTPDFYLKKVVELFPDTKNRLINWYNAGYMAGLTQHYSINAIFISLGIMILFSKISSSSHKNNMDIIAFVVMVVALLLTGKRAHILFIVASIYVTYYFLLSKNKKTRTFKIIGSIIFLLFAFFIASSIFPSLGNFIQRFQETINKGDITENRYLFWKLAFSIIKKSPIKGIGWDNFQWLSLEVINYKAHTHNIYLQLLCETGIIGFTIYMSWFSLMYIRTIKVFKKVILDKESDNEKFLITFSLSLQTFFLLYGLTGNPLYDKEMFIPYFIACSISIYFYKKYIKKVMKNGK